jgi:hypothetical protein
VERGEASERRARGALVREWQRADKVGEEDEKSEENGGE